MGKTINTFVAAPFTNSIGQTINPGDRVAYITHGWSVHMGKGWSDGVYKNEKGDVVLTRVQGIMEDTKTELTGNKLTYTYMHQKYDYETRKYMPVEASYEYDETVTLPVEPYGTTVLQCHRIIKIEG
jgi:hypothetical protein